MVPPVFCWCRGEKTGFVGYLRKLPRIFGYYFGKKWERILAL